MIKQADSLFDGRIKDVKSINEMKKAVESGSIARCAFCSVDKDGENCAMKIEKEIIGATVRGTKLEKEKVSGNCAICGKKAHEIIYVAKQY